MLGVQWAITAGPAPRFALLSRQAIRRRERLGIKREKNSWRWARDDDGGRAG